MRKKCVFLYRTEKWNSRMENSIVDSRLDRQANLFYSMDYFDFCLAVTPNNNEELLGRFIESEQEVNDKIHISRVISSFNKNSSSKQTFSFCLGREEKDPFNQDLCYLIISNISLNPLLFKDEDLNEVYEKVEEYKSELRNILQESLGEDDVYNIYNLLSNEDFSVAVATNNPARFLSETLIKIRSKKYMDGEYSQFMFPHTFTILSYALVYNEFDQSYSVRGKDEFPHSHILRARASKNTWMQCHRFPQVINEDWKVCNDVNLIGKYNIIFRLNSREFGQIMQVLIKKKLGLIETSKEILKYDISTIDDIKNMVINEGFSYVNERILFSGTSFPGEKNTKIFERSNRADELIREPIRKLGNEIERMMETLRKELIYQDDKNQLYRIGKIYESTMAMGRNIYMASTVSYILRFIELLLREALDNLEYTSAPRNKNKKLCVQECREASKGQKDRDFSKYFNIGAGAISVLFTICTDKLYDNLQAPNYEVDYTFATEKILRAYAQLLKEFSDRYLAVLERNRSTNIYYPLVIPSSEDTATYMRVLFQDASLRSNSLKIDGDSSDIEDRGEMSTGRIVLINTPFDCKILDLKNYLPVLFHEYGHYLPPANREKRNKLIRDLLCQIMAIQITECLEELLNEKYGWTRLQRVKEQDYSNAFLTESVDLLTVSLKTLYGQAGNNSLLDIYIDQLRGVTDLLFQETNRYHHFFWEAYQEIKKTFPEQNSLRDKEKKVEDACLALIINKDMYGSGGGSIYALKTSDFSSCLLNCFGCYIEGEDETKLKDYQNACKNLCCEVCHLAENHIKDLVKELETVLGEEGIFPEFVRGFNLTDEELGFRYGEICKNHSEKKDLIMALFDRYMHLAEGIRVMDYFCDAIVKADSTYDITEEIWAIQEAWIAGMYEFVCNNSLVPRKANGSSWNMMNVRRRTGMDVSVSSSMENEEIRKAKFTAFIKCLVRKLKDAYSDENCFDITKLFFREAMADYTMCQVCDYDSKKYLAASKEMIYDHDLHLYRVGLVLYLLNIDNNEEEWETFITELEKDNFSKNIIKKFNRLFAVCNELKEEIEDNIKYIRQVSSDLNIASTILRQDPDDDVVRFYLKYYYRSRAYDQEG